MNVNLESGSILVCDDYGVIGPLFFPTYRRGGIRIAKGWGKAEWKWKYLGFGSRNTCVS